MLVALSVFSRYTCGSQLPIMYPETPPPCDTSAGSITILVTLTHCR